MIERLGMRLKYQGTDIDCKDYAFMEHIISLVLRLSSQEIGGGVVTSMVNIVQLVASETGGAYQIAE